MTARGTRRRFSWMRNWQARVRPHWIEIVLGAAIVLVAAMVGTAQVFIYIRQADIMKTQAKIAKGQLTEQQSEGRAWVSINAPESPPIFSAPLTYDVNNGAQIQLLLTLNNYGHTPAQNVSSYFEAFPVECHTPTECLVIQKHVCDVAATSSAFQFIVFPGEHPQLKEMQFISNDAIAAATAKLPPTFKVISPYIYLCITYNIFGDNEKKHTPYVFEVIQKTPTGEVRGVIRISDGIIPANELILTPSISTAIMNAD